MTGDPRTPCIVVGYDGSPPARAALALDRLVDADPRLATIDYQTEVIGGRPAVVIAGVAEARGADSIIIGTRGFGRVRAVLGSVAHELLHEAGCPVTVIPEAALERADDAGPLEAGISER